MNNFVKYFFVSFMLSGFSVQATPEEIPAVSIDLTSELTSQAHGLFLPCGGLGLCCALDCANDCAERTLEKSLHKAGLSMKQRAVRQALSTCAHAFAYAFTTELVNTCLPEQMLVRCNFAVPGPHGDRYYSDVYDLKPVVIATMPTICALTARLITRKISTLTMRPSTRNQETPTDTDF